MHPGSDSKTSVWKDTVPSKKVRRQQSQQQQIIKTVLWLCVVSAYVQKISNYVVSCGQRRGEMARKTSTRSLSSSLSQQSVKY